MNLPPEAGLSLSPYPGLRPFRRDEADIFFGREEQVDELLAKLESCRFLAVVGTSGCGKSSLVRAGMLSALAGGFMASAGPRWHVVEMRPGGHPLANLGQALLRGETLSPEWRGRDDAEAFVRAVLRRGPLGLVELLREALAPSRNNLLLLVDQFEEIFRFHKHGDANEATAFVDVLLESARQALVPIYVVLTMRSDFLGDCATFAGLPEAINAGQFLIPRLAREQCRAAVAGPAAAFGATVEPELVNHVLNDIGSDPDQLPLMQHALMRVWNRTGAADRAEPALTLAEYQAVGGLKHALSNHADELFESLTPENRRVAETLFRSLSERGADGRDIRRPVPLAALAEVAQVAQTVIVDVVEVFRDPRCSFLTPPAGVPLTGDTVIDISHESLIRQWQRMTQWVQAEADSAAIYRRLAGTADLWQAGQAALWVTPDLENALCWRAREQPSAAWAQRYGGRFATSIAFLEASVAAHERRLREDQARQEHERQLLENMARAEKQRADAAEQRRIEQAQANKQLKRRAVTALATGVLALFLAAIAFFLFANGLLERQRADDARADAERARERAEKDRQEAQTARARADQLADRQVELRLQAEKAEVASLNASQNAFQSLGQANFSQLQSLWNSSQPGRQTQAFELLRKSAELRDTALGLALRQGPAQHTATQKFWDLFTPRLRDEAVRWLSLSSLQKVYQASFAGPVPNYYSSAGGPLFAASPDLKQLAILDVDPRDTSKRELRLEDPRTGTVAALFKFPPTQSAILALGYTEDGATLLVASRASSGSAVQVQRRSAADLKAGPTVMLPDSAQVTASLGFERCWFDGHGSRLIYTSTSQAIVWDIATGKRLFSDAVVAAGLTETDQLVALRRPSLKAALAARVIDLKGQAPPREFSLSGTGPGTAAASVSPDGKWLAVELGRRYQNDAYWRPLVLFDLARGVRVAEVLLPTPDTYSSSENLLRSRFFDKRPILTACDGQTVWLIAVPDGGILYQAALSDVRGNRRIQGHHVQISREGDLLMTAVRESTSTFSSEPAKILVHYWDASVASARQALTAGGAVQDLHFAGDDALVAAGASADRTVVQLRTVQGTGQWETRSSRPSGGFDPSGKHFVHVLPDRFDIHDAATGKLCVAVPRKSAAVLAALPADKSHRWLVGVDETGAAPRLRLFDATQLRWATPLEPADLSQLSQVKFDDHGTHVALHAGGAIVAYRTRDGARALDAAGYTSTTTLKFTDAGYLLTKSFTSTAAGGYVLRAFDLKTGRLLSEIPTRSSSSSGLDYQFWIDAAGTSAALLDGPGPRYQLALWPFAAGKDLQKLPIECTSTSSNQVVIAGDRLFVSAYFYTEKAAKKSTHALQLWDLKTAQVMQTRTVPNYTSIQVSAAHGKALVQTSTLDPATWEVWDLKSGKTLATLRGYVFLSRDMRFAAFSSGQVLDLATMKERPLRAQAVNQQYKFSPDSRYLVDASSIPGVRVFDLYQPTVHWSPEEVIVPTAGEYKAPPEKAKTAKATKKKKAAMATEQAPPGWQLAEISPDSRVIGFFNTNAPDRLHVYSLATGKKLHTLVIRRGNFQVVPRGEDLLPQFWFSADGTHVAVIAADQLHLGNIDQPQVHTALARTSHRSAVHAVAPSPDGRLLASAGADGTVCFWRSADGRFLGTADLGGLSDVVRRLSFCPRGNVLAARKNSGEIRAWKWSRPESADAEVTLEPLWTYALSKGAPLAFSPDGKLLAAGDTDGGVRLLHADTGRLAHWLRPVGGSGAVQALAFTPDGKYLAATRGPVVALWDVQAARQTRAWDAGQGPIHDLAFERDGRFLATTGRDLRLWSAGGELLLTLDQRSASVRHPTFSSSGRRLAVTVDDRTIMVTNVTELIDAVDKLGLRATTSTSLSIAWTKPLWAAQPREKIAAENTLVEFLPLADRAERAQDWEGAVAHLTRLLAVEPGNAGFRARRRRANEHLEDWPAAAADFLHELDLMPNDQFRDSARSRALLKALQEQPEVFATLEKLRPKEPLFTLVRGRALVLESKWPEAKKAYQSVVTRLPLHEECYEYASLCLICGDKKAYHDHIAWMLQQEKQPQDDHLSYNYARAASLTPECRIDTAQTVAWAEAALAKTRQAWRLHVAGMAYCRAGRLEKAKEALGDSLRTTWGAQILNQLMLGIVEHRLGNYEAARDHLDKARAWQASVAEKTPGVPTTDWLEFHVLLPELEALIARADAVKAAWKAPGPELTRRLTEAQGFAADDFALVQALPQEQFAGLAEALKEFGYRPQRLRPYRSGDRLLVAALWKRDGRDWRLVQEKTAAEIAEEAVRLEEQEFEMIDLAGYLQGPEAIYAALWARVEGMAPRTKMLAGITSTEHAKAWPALKKDGLRPTTNQAFSLPGGAQRYCNLWGNSHRLAWLFHYDNSANEFVDLVRGKLKPLDVSLWVRLEPRATPASAAACVTWPVWGQLAVLHYQHVAGTPRVRHAATFVSAPDHEAAEAHGLTPDQHLERCRQLAAEGYRPLGLAVIEPAPGQPQEAASVWWRRLKRP